SWPALPAKPIAACLKSGEPPRNGHRHMPGGGTRPRHWRTRSSGTPSSWRHPMTTLSTDQMDVLLSRLEGVRKTGDRYEARCAAHKDRSPSLSLSRGDDGRVLIHCHAGCQTKDVLAGVGMEFRDLFPGSLSQEQRLAYRRAALEKERKFE